MTEWFEGFIDDWNTHDGERVASWMVEDVIFDDVALGVVHKSREAIQALVARNVAFSDDNRMTLVSFQQKR